MNKLIILLGIVMFFSASGVFADCSNSWSGSYSLLADETCADENEFLFEVSGSDLTINCNGFKMSCEGCYQLFNHAGGRHLTLNDCNIYVGDAIRGEDTFYPNPSELYGTDSGDGLTINNSSIIMNISNDFVSFTSQSDNYINMFNSRIINTISSTTTIFSISDDGGSVLINMSENNISEQIGTLQLFNSDFTTTISDSTNVGNYYNISGYNCIDSDFDGICENAYTIFGVTDNYPLSDYYWNPYIQPQETPAGFVAQYDESDIAEVGVDILVKFILTVGVFISIIIIGNVVVWGYNKI